MRNAGDHGADQPLDWDRIAAWTDDIATGDLSRIWAVFRGHGADVTDLTWVPPPSLLPPVLDFLAGYWNGLTRNDGNGGRLLPHLAQIDPFAMRPALGYVILLDVVDGGRDFRYRLHGSLLTEISGFDMTGRMLSDFRASRYVAEFAVAADRATCRRREPVYARRRPVGAERVMIWHRLCLPLVDDGGDVARLLVGSVPIDAHGEILRF